MSITSKVAANIIRRALGTDASQFSDKEVIIRIYIIEILITSFIVMIPTTLIVTGVLEFIEHLPASKFAFDLTVPAYFATILALFILNVLVGILPISLIMRKTPAELVSSYDL